MGFSCEETRSSIYNVVVVNDFLWGVMYMDEKEMAEKIKDGVRIMSIDARYLYKMQDNETGYDSSLHWNKERNVLPRKLYKVEIPYSLGIIYWLSRNPSNFKEIGNQIYLNDIINVTFDGAAKVKAEDEKGNIKYKPCIKENKRGRYSLEIVEELVKDKGVDDLKDMIYEGFILDGEKYVQFMRTRQFDN